MDAVMRGARRLSQWSLWFSGALVLLAAVLIGIDVVLRKLFSTSIGGADELAGYALAIGAAWSLAAALLDRAHIRIDSLYVLLPMRMRLVLDFAGLALFVAFFGLIAWHGSSMVMQSWRSASRSQSALQTPTVIPQSIWILGLVIFVVIGALRWFGIGKTEAALYAVALHILDILPVFLLAALYMRSHRLSLRQLQLESAENDLEKPALVGAGEGR